MLAERGEVAVTLGELNDLRALAANGADTAELAQETANLISLLHFAQLHAEHLLMTLFHVQ